GPFARLPRTLSCSLCATSSVRRRFVFTPRCGCLRRVSGLYSLHPMVRKEVLQQERNQLICVGPLPQLTRQRQETLEYASTRAFPDLAHMTLGPQLQRFLGRRHRSLLEDASVPLFERGERGQLASGNKIDRRSLFADASGATDAMKVNGRVLGEGVVDHVSEI